LSNNPVHGPPVHGPPVTIQWQSVMLSGWIVDYYELSTCCVAVREN